jgi:nucleotide-binding universal stress UspA family protein
MDVARVRRPVVAGTDGSDGAHRAAVWAAAEAVRRGSTLRLVTALPPMGERPAGRRSEEWRGRPDLLAAARGRLDEAVAAARGRAPGLEVVDEVVVGDPVEVLDTAARGAELLVVGKRGSGGFTGLQLGSVAAAVAALATCPVVVVRGGEPSASQPVVLGVDGTPASDAATAFAFEAAAARGAALVVVHTWSDPAAEFGLASEADGRVVEQEERRLLAERLAGWSEKYPDVAVQRVVTRAHPVPELVTRSHAAQLLVVGRCGHATPAGVAPGSVSQGVLHRSDCPVAVVPSGVGATRWA